MSNSTVETAQSVEPRTRPAWLTYSLWPPLLLFVAFLLWSWRNWHLASNVPAYGDVLEVVWGLQWYAEALQQGRSPFYTPLVFHPAGWHTATLAHSPYFFLAALPLYLLGGPAFAYNVLALLGLVAGYSGMYLAARRYLEPLPAALAATAYAFSTPFIFRLGAHMNILGGLALLPWLLWAVWRAQERGLSGPRLLGIGLLWGAAIAFSFYFVFLGGVVLLGCWLWPVAGRPGLKKLLAVAAVACVVNLPLFLLFWQARTADQVVTWDLVHLNSWGTSLNSVMAPPVHTPLFGSLGRLVYRGRLGENSMLNVGLIGGLLALASLRNLRRRPALRVLTALFLTGIILSLGVYLKWDNRAVSLPLLRPLNEGLWTAGHWLKPELFPTSTPPPGLENGIPLPNFFLAMLVPFWEGVRTTARLLIPALLAMPILAAYTLQHIHRPSLRYALAALWLLEILPAPFDAGQPLPDAPHPAHAWIAEHIAPGRAIIDLWPEWPLHDGATLLATRFHQTPTISGVGSQWPAHTAFLDAWYREHGPLHPDFAPLLARYGVQYVLFYTLPDTGQTVIDLDQTAGFSLVDCFAPLPWPFPWPYPICVLEVETAGAAESFFHREGWYEAEPWGVWARGESSRLQWVALRAGEDALLTLEAFPHCAPDRRQSITIYAAETVLATHTWDKNCVPWTAELPIPGRLVEVGWNELRFEYAYAAWPLDVSGGTNPDRRELSVGFSRLEVRSP